MANKRAASGETPIPARSRRVKKTGDATTNELAVARVDGTGTGTAWPDGLCATEAGEALFRQGFPHIRWLTDEVIEDPARVALSALTSVEPVLDFGWPRSVAERAVQGYLAIGARFAAASPNDPAVVEAVQSPAPLGEPRQMFRQAMSRDCTSKDFAVEDFVFLAEAFVGADAVCDGILAALEAEPGILQRRGDALAIARCLGFLMLRAENPEAFRGRLSEIRLKAQGKKVAPTKLWSALLMTLLDGDAAFDGFGHALKYYVFVKDRVRLVQKLVEAPGEFLPDMRFVYIGGPEVLALYERRIDELPRGALARRFLAELSFVRRSIAEPLMRQLARRPDVGERATAWLHGC